MGASAIAHGALGLLVYMAAAAVLQRLRPRSSPSATVLAAAAGAWVLTLAVLVAAHERVNFWAFCVSYGFFALCFLMAFGAIHKSISLRMVACLWHAPGRTLSVAALEQAVLRPSYEERLALVVERGYATRSGERWALAPEGARLVRSVRALQALFGIGRSG
jgi:hypothetical protein